jgi:hypothetical protein
VGFNRNHADLPDFNSNPALADQVVTDGRELGTPIETGIGTEDAAGVSPGFKHKRAKPARIWLKPHNLRPAREYEVGAGGGSRTRTLLQPGVLKPVRLPVPPHPHVGRPALPVSLPPGCLEWSAAVPRLEGVAADFGHLADVSRQRAWQLAAREDFPKPAAVWGPGGGGGGATH